MDPTIIFELFNLALPRYEAVRGFDSFDKVYSDTNSVALVKATRWGNENFSREKK